jgi:hypothetical protein
VVDEILRAFGLEHLVATRAVSRLLSLEGAMMPRSHRRAYSAIVPGSSKRGDAPSATPQQDTAIGKRKSLDELSPSPVVPASAAHGEQARGPARTAPHQEGSDTGWQCGTSLPSVDDRMAKDPTGMVIGSLALTGPYFIYPELRGGKDLL